MRIGGTKTKMTSGTFTDANQRIDASGEEEILVEHAELVPTDGAFVRIGSDPAINQRRRQPARLVGVAR